MADKGNTKSSSSDIEKTPKKDKFKPKSLYWGKSVNNSDDTEDIGTDTIKNTRDRIAQIDNSFQKGRNTVKKGKKISEKGIETSVKAYQKTKKTIKRLKEGDVKITKATIKRVAKNSAEGTAKVVFKGAVVTAKGAVKYSKNAIKEKIKSGMLSSDDLTISSIGSSVNNLKTTIEVGRRANNTRKKAQKATKKIKRKATKIFNKKNNGKGSLDVNKKLEMARKNARVKKMAQKAAQKAKAVAKAVIEQAIKTKLRGIIACAIGIIFLLITMISAICGINATATSVPNIADPDAFVKQMKKIDKTTNTKMHSGHSLAIKYDSFASRSTSWKDVIAVYCAYYNNDPPSLSSNTAIGGSSTNTNNPELWNTVYTELQSHLGEAYVYGGSTPETGFDCSGLVQYCFSVGGIELPRTSYEQCGVGEEVSSEDDLQPGDLVFFMGSDPQDGLPGHVGVYIGNDQYIQAPQTGDVVKVSNMSDRSDYWGARRVITADTSNSSSSDSSSNSNSSSSSNSGTSNTISDQVDGSLADIITEIAKKYSIDPNLIAAVIQEESSFNQYEVSSTGACGYMQLEPDTFGEQDVGDSIFDAYQNIEAGTKYLSTLLERYDNNLDAALMSYNGGPGAYDANPDSSALGAYRDAVEGYYSDYRNGQPIPDTMVSGTAGSSSKVDATLKKIYDLFNTITTKRHDHKTKVTLTKHDMDYVMKQLNFDDDQKEMAKSMMKGDAFGDVIPNFDFKFDLNYSMKDKD